jgi:hypothetical protein
MENKDYQLKGAREMAEWFSTSLLFIEGYSSFLNYPRYIEPIHSAKGKMDQLLKFWSESQELFTKLFCLDAPFTTTLCVASGSLKTMPQIVA